jgi:hypothetical protein
MRRERNNSAVAQRSTGTSCSSTGSSRIPPTDDTTTNQAPWWHSRTETIGLIDYIDEQPKIAALFSGLVHYAPQLVHHVADRPDIGSSTHRSALESSIGGLSGIAGVSLVLLYAVPLIASQVPYVLRR